MEGIISKIYLETYIIKGSKFKKKRYKIETCKYNKRKIFPF